MILGLRLKARDVALSPCLRHLEYLFGSRLTHVFETTEDALGAGGKATSAGSIKADVLIE